MFVSCTLEGGIEISEASGNDQFRAGRGFEFGQVRGSGKRDGGDELFDGEGLASIEAIHQKKVEIFVPALGKKVGWVVAPPNAQVTALTHEDEQTGEADGVARAIAKDTGKVAVVGSVEVFFVPAEEIAAEEIANQIAKIWFRELPEKLLGKGVEFFRHHDRMFTGWSEVIGEKTESIFQLLMIRGASDNPRFPCLDELVLDKFPAEMTGPGADVGGSIGSMLFEQIIDLVRPEPELLLHGLPDGRMIIVHEFENRGEL